VLDSNAGNNVRSSPGRTAVPAAHLVSSPAIASLVKRGALGALAIKVANAVIAAAVQLLLARLLGATSYGDYVYAITLQTVLLLVATLGFDTASLRFVAQYSGQQRWGLLLGYIKRSLAIILGMSVALGILAAVIAWTIRSRLSSELTITLMLAFLLLPPNATLQLRSLTLQGLKHVVIAQAPRDILRPILLGLGVWLAVKALGYPASAPLAMLANLAAVICVLGLTTVLLNRILPTQVRNARPEYQARAWHATAFALLLVAGMNLVLNRTDMLMIGAITGTREAGIYAVATRGAEVILLGLSSVNAIAAPLIADLHARGQREELQRVLRRAARGIDAFAVPATVAAVLCGRMVLGLFGAEFTEGYNALTILACGQLVNSLAGPVGFLITMTGHHKIAVKVLFISATLNILLNATFIPLWGLEGAAVATALTTVLWNLAMSYYAWKYTGVRATAL